MSKSRLDTSSSSIRNSTSSSTIYSDRSSYRPSNSSIGSSGQDTVLSTTLSGRSLFDYSTAKTAINTPSSRIYDGQLRRTATTRFVRDKLEINYSPKEQAAKKLDSNNNTSSTVLSNNISPTYSGSHNNDNHDNDKNSKLSSGQSCIAKPFRSSSLKLRASYTNILDQLTSTTFAKLKLGSSANNTGSNRSSQVHERSIGVSRHRDNLTSTRSGDSRSIQPTLAVVRDEPEAEAAATRLDADKRLYPPIKLSTDSSLTATSPDSSSSGLSSGGIVGEVHSPSSTSSSSVSSKQGEYSPPVNKELPSGKLSNSQHVELKSMEDSGHSNGDSTIEDLSSEEEESESSTEDDNDDNVDGDGQIEDIDQDDDEEQQTIISPVDRKLLYLDKELGLNKNTPASRDQLYEAGLILAELKELDSTQDCEMVSDNVLPGDTLLLDPENCSSQLDIESILKPSNSAINESELILKPRLFKTQASRLEPIIMEINSGDVKTEQMPILSETNDFLVQSKSLNSVPTNNNKQHNSVTDEDNISELGGLQDGCDEVSRDVKCFFLILRENFAFKYEVVGIV